MPAETTFPAGISRFAEDISGREYRVHHCATAPTSRKGLMLRSYYPDGFPPDSLQTVSILTLAYSRGGTITVDACIYRRRELASLTELIGRFRGNGEAR